MKIHTTALVDAGACLDEDVEVGAYCVIKKGVVIGSKTRLGCFVVLEENTRIGRENVIGHGVVIGCEPQDKKFKGEKSSVEIGDRNIFREYVTIHRACGEGNTTRVGNGNFLMVSSHIGHNCIVGNKIIMTNYVGLGGYAQVDDGAIFGGLTGVHQFVRVGRMSMVGGHTAVRKDVLPFSLVSGDPARLYGLNSIGLRRQGMSASVRKAIRKAYDSILKCATSHEAAQILEKSDVPEVRELAAFIKESKRGFTKLTPALSGVGASLPVPKTVRQTGQADDE